MNRQFTFLTIVFILLIKVGYGQQHTKDSCDIKIYSWFEPACRVDTCMNVNWLISYGDKCGIYKVLYKIYNPTKTKVIYKSNKIWDGKTNNPLGYYKADYYPYEITFYTKDKKTIMKTGKVYLHIW